MDVMPHFTYGTRMYLRSQLDGYAAQIADPEQARRFRTVVDGIAFDTKELCVGAALDAFNGTAVEDLRADFEARHLEFLTSEAFAKVTGQA